MSEGNSEAGPALGVLVVAIALLPYLAASGVLPSDDSDFGAPRWVVGWIAVVCFLLPGVLVLGRGDPTTGAGLACRGLAALVPTALAVHATSHALTRAGGVQAAWLALALLVAAIALAYWWRLLTSRG